jgi:hypothetical protein
MAVISEREVDFQVPAVRWSYIRTGLLRRGWRGLRNRESERLGVGTESVARNWTICIKFIR